MAVVGSGRARRGYFIEGLAGAQPGRPISHRRFDSLFDRVQRLLPWAVKANA